MKRALAMGLTGTALLGAAALAWAGDIGFLDVAAQRDDGSPVAASIFLDDAGVRDDAGRALTTPQTHLPVAVGHHNLVLVTADGKTSHIGFSIQKGQSTSLTLHPH